MSDIIRLLPDSVANQIAAGEVIQRPASVIKELMENSIDAGATLVQVVVDDAGKTMIQVADNGKGMSPTDARLAFERHATSKISSASDLYALRTMGFRGEALPSIVAVSQMTLKTKRAEDELGTQLQIDGSKFIEQTEVNCPQGTNFVVKNLFFNMPVRRKFLKSNTTELNAIISEFERIVLAHPEVAFKLYSADALIFDLPISNIRQRIVNVFGKRLDKQLLPLEVDTTLVKLKGFVGTPESAKKKGANQFFFVNGRFMRHAAFSKAVLNAYNHIIPEGEQVPFFLSLEVEPERIDVNIHPAKTEIKFQDESAIWQIILAAVRESLGKHNAVPTIDFDTENRPDIPAFNPTACYTPPTVEFDASYNPFETLPSSSPIHTFSAGTGKSQTPGFGEEISRLGKKTASPGEKIPSSEEKIPSLAVTGMSFEEQSEAEEVKNATLYDDSPEKEKQTWIQEEVQLFQYRGKYIVLPAKSGLMFVHQHRAHVRVLYNRYLKQLSQGNLPSQGLLFPEMLELSAREAIILQQNAESIERIGFDITSLGGNAFSVNAIPSGVDDSDIHGLVMGVVNGLQEIGENVYHILALALARQTAIRGGMGLHKDQMELLIEQLFMGDMPSHTPDGKQIIATIADDNIEKLF